NVRRQRGNGTALRWTTIRGATFAPPRRRSASPRRRSSGRWERTRRAGAGPPPARLSRSGADHFLLLGGTELSTPFAVPIIMLASLGSGARMADLKFFACFNVMCGGRAALPDPFSLPAPPADPTTAPHPTHRPADRDRQR